MSRRAPPAIPVENRRSILPRFRAAVTSLCRTGSTRLVRARARRVFRGQKNCHRHRLLWPIPGGRSACEPGSPRAKRDHPHEKLDGSRGRFLVDTPRLPFLRPRCPAVRRAFRLSEEIPRNGWAARVQATAVLAAMGPLQLSLSHTKAATQLKHCDIATEFSLVRLWRRGRFDGTRRRRMRRSFLAKYPGTNYKNLRIESSAS